MTDLSMGGQFRNILFPLTIEKTPHACGRGCTSNSGKKIELNDYGLLPSNISMNQNIINSNQNFDAFTIVHEIGHAWDMQRNNILSRGLEAYTNGHTNFLEGVILRHDKSHWCDNAQKKPGCNDAGYFYGGIPLFGSGSNFNRYEDYANSVAVFVFPVEAQAVVQQKYAASNNALHNYLYWDMSTLHNNPRWLYIYHEIHGMLP